MGRVDWAPPHAATSNSLLIPDFRFGCGTLAA